MSGAKEICASEAGIFWLKEVPSPKCDLLWLFSHTLNLCMDWAIWSLVSWSTSRSGGPTEQRKIIRWSYPESRCLMFRTWPWSYLCRQTKIVLQENSLSCLPLIRTRSNLLQYPVFKPKSGRQTGKGGGGRCRAEEEAGRDENRGGKYTTKEWSRAGLL